MSQSYILSIEAEEDVNSILEYTFQNYGELQMIKYKDQLTACIEHIVRSRGRVQYLSEIDQHLRFIHCQHHYVFGLSQGDKPFNIIAILHEKMDLKNRVKERLENF